MNGKRKMQLNSALIIYSLCHLVCRCVLLIVTILCLQFPIAAHADSRSATINSFKFIGINQEPDNPKRVFPNADIEPAPLTASIAVNYSYDGSMGQAYMGAKAISQDGTSGLYYERAIKAGAENIQIIMMTRPDKLTQIKTDQIEIIIYTKENGTNQEKTILAKTFAWPIYWPEKRMRAQAASESKESYHEKLLAEAIEIIDNIDSLGSKDLDVAKRNLDTIILEDPNNAQAYLELARIAMKSDYSATESARYAGLDEAQRLIKVALRVNPAYANSYILFGYVLAVQGRTEEAIIAFKKAQQIGTKNMWLYYNWGLALENANRIDEAIKKYQEGVALTPVPDTKETHSNNRAIPFIFSNLMNLLFKRNDIAAIDALYQKRLALFDESCQKTFYGQFKLYKMGDYDAAIKWGTKAQEQNCRAGARPLLAAAYFTKWALDTSKSNQKERETLLNRAQAFLSDTPQTIVDLASSPFTARVLPRLKDAGLLIDGLDAKGMTPLAYAAASGDQYAVQSLVNAGANPNVTLKGGVTPLMIAVMSNKIDVVRALLRAKVNTDQKTNEGQTAISMARMLGNAQIIELLNKNTQF